MWDMQESCTKTASEQLLANNRHSTIHDLITSIPEIYYKNVSKPIIVDKCRSWTLPDNIALIKKYITTTPKIIVLVRPLNEIFMSFGNLKPELIEEYTKSQEPIYRSFCGTLYAKNNNKGEFLFINYDDLVNSTKETLKKIYSFCEWDNFEHNLTNILNTNPENDEVYGIKGQHEVRSTIQKRHIKVELPKEISNKCNEMNGLLFS